MAMPILYVGAECRLENGNQELLSTLKKTLTIPNPKYQAAQKYSRWGVGKKFPQKLFFYKEEKHGLLMPRGFARQIILACLAQYGEQPEIVDHRRTLDEQGFTFQGELRPYQQEAVEAVLAKEFGVLEAGTGSGKTVMGLAVIASRGQPTLVLVHTKELLYQWAQRIETFLGISAGLVGDGHYQVEPLTVAIVNTARRRLDDLCNQFGHIVVDECHRVPASLFTEVVNGFDAKYALGLSATAFRREDVLTRLIYFYMGERIFSIDARTLQEDGAILRPKIIPRPTGFTYTYRDDYARMMTALTLDDGRNRQIADDVVGTAREHGTILVVSDRVAHCEKLAELIEKRGGQVALLTGRLAADKRAEIVASIAEGRLDILVATLQLIGEGFDASGLSALFLATPIKFSGRLQQVIGRILRPAKGKQATVYDYVDEKVGILRHSARQRQKTYLSMV